MGEDILVTERIEAGANFIREFNDYVPVSVACWVIPAKSDNAYLYIASDQIDDSNFDVAYGEVLRRSAANRSQWLDPFRVKLVNTSNPMAQDAIEIRDRFPASLLTSYRGSFVGGMIIEGAYVYPPRSAMKVSP